MTIIVEFETLEGAERIHPHHIGSRYAHPA
jgi:hypothetical protein